MDFASLFARIGAGFAVRAAAGVAALYAGAEAWRYIADTLDTIGKAFP